MYKCSGVNFHLKQELCGVEEVVGFAVELDRFDRLVLVEQVLGVLGEQRVDLAQVVLLGEFDGAMPLVELHTRVHCLLDLIALQRNTIN